MPLSPEQIAARRTGLTATDMVILSGVAPFFERTAHDVFAEKIGLDVPPLKGERFELGHELEPIVIRRTAAKRGLTPVPGDTMRHPRTPIFLATPDAFHVPDGARRAEAVIEAKAVGLGGASSWGPDESEEIPDHVLVQVAWQMLVCMVPVAFVGALIGTEIRTYRIELGTEVAEMLEALKALAEQFWTDHVVARKPPTIDGSEGSARMVKALFPAVRGPVLRAGPEAEEAARLYFAAQKDMAQAGRELDRAKQILMASCGDCEGIDGDGWRLRLKERPEKVVTPRPYTLPPYRHFDMRTAGGGKREAAA